MRRFASPKRGGYAGLTACWVLAALVLRRPELVVLAAPFALALAAGLALTEPADVRARLTVSPERALEGDEIDVTVELQAGTPVERLDVLVAVPDGISVVAGEPVQALHLRAGERRTIALRLRADRWGGYTLGRIELRARAPLGLTVEEGRASTPAPLRVYPREEHLRNLLAPHKTQANAGNQVARTKGDGIEFADLRQFVPGDHIRRINWRASARRRELWVNETHPERNTDVVLFVDSFAEAALNGRSTLDLAVRATSTLAARYLERRDRVGLVGFGGVLRWLLPGSGTVQAYRIADALLDTEVVLSYAWKDVEVLPRRTLPPHALVLALSPLLDLRSVGALLDLRHRGFDVAVIDITPLPFTPPAPGEEIAHRLWQLQRAGLRSRYERAGVAVAEWSEQIPLQVTLEEVRAFRRYAGRG